MADRVAVMNAGRIVQVGRPQELYDRPASRFVADFLGEANFIDGIVQQAGPTIIVRTAAGVLVSSPAPTDTTHMSTGPQDHPQPPAGPQDHPQPPASPQDHPQPPVGPQDYLRAPVGPQTAPVAVGQSVTCCVRPERIGICPAIVAPAGPTLLAQVESSTYLGELRQYRCGLEAQASWKVTVLTSHSAPLPVGTKVALSVAPQDVIVLTA